MKGLLCINNVGKYGVNCIASNRIISNSHFYDGIQYSLLKTYSTRTVSSNLKTFTQPLPSRLFQQNSKYLNSFECSSLIHTSHSSAQEKSEQKVTTSEPKVATSEEHEFQAETRMLLDIVARSLYSDKEVFLRELVSNASDALEKVRCLAVQGIEVDTSSEVMKITIDTDKQNRTLTIIDTGIGMTKEELVSNLGVIARSGSKEFLQELNKSGAAGASTQNIIGQFGVGFYSAFMVADKVKVYSRSNKADSVGYCWQSDGLGKYTIEECDNVTAGTKIICHLKVNDRQFSDDSTVKAILKKYSSFVGFPIEVNGDQVNTIEPLWLKDPKQVTPEEHTEFYRFIGAVDQPRFTLHFQTDAPVNLRALLYFPEGRPGLFEYTKSEDSGVSLYCRKVLIMSNIDSLLPKWLRFVKGTVDSEDIPLNLSREMLQDSALIRRLRTVIQNKVVRFLLDKSRKDPENYLSFYKDYAIFIKEGILSSTEDLEKEELSRLLKYESSMHPAGTYVDINEYISRMQDTQKQIFYLAAPSRELAEASPYFEAMKKRNVEVLFTYETYDEVVLMQLKSYNGKDIVSAEKEVRQSKETVDFKDGVGLEKAVVNDLLDWIKGSLVGRCFSVKATPLLEQHPCIVTVEEMGAARHFVKTQFSQLTDDMRYSMLRPQLEINSSHPIVMKMNSLRTQNPRLAELLIKQLFNNAMVTAGLIEDPRTVLTTMNELLELALEKH